MWIIGVHIWILNKWKIEESTISSSSNDLPLYVEWSEGWGHGFNFKTYWVYVLLNKNKNKGKSTRRMPGLIGAVNS